MPFPSRYRIDCRAAAAILSVAAVVVLLAIAIRDPALGKRLVSEDNVVEWLQVVLAGTTGVLAFQDARAARRTGQPIALDVAIVGAMAIICIGEVDLDRVFFGTKIISTRFFVDGRRWIVWRVLAVLVIVGAPLALGIWLLVHVRELWRSGMTGLRQPWGQTAAFGMALFLAVEVFEKKLSRISSVPQYFAEEVLELVGMICILVGVAARRRR
jgi:hypothetical protein